MPRTTATAIERYLKLICRGCFNERYRAIVQIGNIQILEDFVEGDVVCEDCGEPASLKIGLCEG